MPSLYADGLQEMANNALARKLIRHMNKKLNVLLNTHKKPEIKKKLFILKDPNKQALSCNVFEDIDSLCSFISPCFISVNTQYVIQFKCIPSGYYPLLCFISVNTSETAESVL